MEKLFIVVWFGNGFWHEQCGGVFTERRLAENLIECKRANGEKYPFAIVEGPIVNPETMAEVEKRLGAF